MSKPKFNADSTLSQRCVPAGKPVIMVMAIIIVGPFKSINFGK
jgi:hypothetical protein